MLVGVRAEMGAKCPSRKLWPLVLSPWSMEQRVGTVLLCPPLYPPRLCSPFALTPCIGPSMQSKEAGAGMEGGQLVMDAE